MAFRIASSPYTHNRRSTGNIMLLVVLAAVPGFAAQCYFFGYGTFLQVLLATLTAWLTEAAILRLRKAPVASTLADNSALLTAVLIGISLPPLAPWPLRRGRAMLGQTRYQLSFSHSHKRRWKMEHTIFPAHKRLRRTNGASAARTASLYWAHTSGSARNRSLSRGALSHSRPGAHHGPGGDYLISGS